MVSLIYRVQYMCVPDGCVIDIYQYIILNLEVILSYSELWSTIYLMNKYNAYSTKFDLPLTFLFIICVNFKWYSLY